MAEINHQLGNATACKVCEGCGQFFTSRLDKGQEGEVADTSGVSLKHIGRKHCLDAVLAARNDHIALDAVSVCESEGDRANVITRAKQRCSLLVAGYRICAHAVNAKQGVTTNHTGLRERGLGFDKGYDQRIVGASLQAPPVTKVLSLFEERFAERCISDVAESVRGDAQVLDQTLGAVVVAESEAWNLIVKQVVVAHVGIDPAALSVNRAGLHLVGAGA